MNIAWSRLPTTVRLWGALLLLSWVLQSVFTGALPSTIAVAVNVLLWWGVAAGHRWAWWWAVVGMAFGTVVALFGFAVVPDVLDGIPAWLVVWGLLALTAQFVLLLHPQTRAHLRPRTERRMDPPGPIGRDDGSRFRTGQP